MKTTKKSIVVSLKQEGYQETTAQPNSQNKQLCPWSQAPRKPAT